MSRPSPTPTTCSASTVLPEAQRRRSHAEAWVEQVLTQWGLEPALAGRWLAAADTHLRVPAEVVVTAEYDRDLQIFSLEIWRAGRRLYGIDDWLGQP